MAQSEAVPGARPMEAMQLEIAILIPCHNEEAAIGGVISAFHAALPAARIYVYDNNSSDRTVDVATRAGAIVRRETRQGKGNVVRRMFADVEADIYLIVDGDGTYHAPSAPALINLMLSEGLDLVSASRVAEGGASYRPGHKFGNRLLTGMVRSIFGKRFSDMLSGYKVFSRRFVKSFPVLSTGFEIETELTVHALEIGMPVAEIAAPYGTRAEGTSSKLRTFSDGWRIMRTIAVLIKEERPFEFFGLLAGLFASFSVLLAWPLITTYVDTGLVPRLPTAVLVTGLMLLAALSLTCGLILDTVTRGRREMKRHAYLAVPGISARSVESASCSRPAAH